MYRIVVLGLLISAMTGCAMVQAPVLGTMVTTLNAPLSAPKSTEQATKTGMATCHSILGAVAFGDCSIEAASKQGGISTIHHLDYNAFKIFVFYARYRTIAYGT